MSRFLSLVILVLVVAVVVWARFEPADQPTDDVAAGTTSTPIPGIDLATATASAPAIASATATPTPSATAAPATATPTPTATPGVAPVARVDAPSGLLAEPLDTRVRLTWDPVLDATGYLVFRDGSEIPLNALPVAESTFDDLGLTNGRAYHYEVAAVDTFGAVGPRSTPETVTPLPSADW
jgi:hypothetical protein